MVKYRYLYNGAKYTTMASSQTKAKDQLAFRLAQGNLWQKREIKNSLTLVVKPVLDTPTVKALPPTQLELWSRG